MWIGLYKSKAVKIYENGDTFIIEFPNGASIGSKDASEVSINKKDCPSYDEFKGCFREAMTSKKCICNN